MPAASEICLTTSEVRLWRVKFCLTAKLWLGFIMSNDKRCHNCFAVVAQAKLA
ncbi:MAG: hypothetical protein IJX87_05070 [Clostridia bacterium]|nr:hypothetical protein [Clostridia bacterium]